MPDTLVQQIYDILAKSHSPLKAMDISARLKVKRALVNRALYGKLNQVVKQDDDFCWEATAPFRLNNDYLITEVDDVSDDEQSNIPQVLLGSTIDVVYLSGPSKGKESKLTLVSSNDESQSDIKQNSIPTRLNSPIGAAIFKQSQGEIVEYRINDTNAAVLIKSISSSNTAGPKLPHKEIINMPKTPYQSKPIKVYENDTHYLVEICATQKHRASDIPKRRWNRHLTAWVYPKTAELYDALKTEFQKDAEVFDIKPPQVSRVSKASQMSVEEMQTRIEESQKKKTENRKNAEEKFDQQFIAVMDKLEGLTRHVEKIEDTNDAMQDLLLEQVSHAEKFANNQNKDNESEVVSDQALELSLMMIAFEASGRDESFKLYLEQHHPITKPERFITRTHHLLGTELANIGGIPDTSRTTFLDRVNFLQEHGLLSMDKAKSVPQTLKTLNHHRNQVAHNSEMSEFELKSRAITYLMGVASIWDEVASEPV